MIADIVSIGIVVYLVTGMSFAVRYIFPLAPKCFENFGEYQILLVILCWPKVWQQYRKDGMR